MVTIPPAMWTNAAHKHGVLVLGEQRLGCVFTLFYDLFKQHLFRNYSRLLLLAPGTFITEWDDGAVACETFLKDEESYRAIADKLVQICYCYGFDGWLINIENALSVSHILLAVAMVKYKHSIFLVSDPCYPSCSV